MKDPQNLLANVMKIEPSVGSPSRPLTHTKTCTLYPLERGYNLFCSLIQVLSVKNNDLDLSRVQFKSEPIEEFTRDITNHQFENGVINLPNGTAYKLNEGTRVEIKLKLFMRRLMKSNVTANF